MPMQIRGARRALLPSATPGPVDAVGRARTGEFVWKFSDRRILAAHDGTFSERDVRHMQLRVATEADEEESINIQGVSISIVKESTLNSQSDLHLVFRRLIRSTPLFTAYHDSPERTATSLSPSD